MENFFNGWKELKLSFTCQFWNYNFLEIVKYLFDEILTIPFIYEKVIMKLFIVISTIMYSDFSTYGSGLLLFIVILPLFLICHHLLLPSYIFLALLSVSLKFINSYFFCDLKLICSRRTEWQRLGGIHISEFIMSENSDLHNIEVTGQDRTE